MSDQQKKTYIELLRDPRWQKRRLETLQRDNWTCQECSSKEKTLNVHHKYYERGKAPWEYADHVLLTLCEDCHRSYTELTRAITREIGGLDVHTLACVLGYVRGLVAYTRAWEHDDDGSVDVSSSNVSIRDGLIVGVAQAWDLSPNKGLGRVAKDSNCHVPLEALRSLEIEKAQAEIALSEKLDRLRDDKEP